MKNSIKKTKVIRLHVISFFLFVYATVINLFKSNKATHVFYYSKKQKNVIDHLRMFDSIPRPDLQIKGKEYTEMIKFLNGVSKWDDAIIVGIGGYVDINLESKKNSKIGAKLNRILETLTFMVIFLIGIVFIIFAPVPVKIFGGCLSLFFGVIIYDYFNHKLYM